MVYVDNVYIPFKGMKMCHMIADSTEELDGMAKWIGLKVSYKQNEGSFFEHYDVCMSKRKLAVKCGALEIDCKELVSIINAKRNRT